RTSRSPFGAPSVQAPSPPIGGPAPNRPDPRYRRKEGKMKVSKAWPWLGAVFGALALAAAGCGGDDDEAASTGTGEEGAAAAEQVITVNGGTGPPSLA